MKKTWENAKLEELSIGATANGKQPSDNFDGEWVQIGDLWYKPGDDNQSK